jgi:hypothetical protein
MSTSSVIYGLWFAGLGFQAFLLAVLLGKGMWRRFPFFTAYSFFTLLETVATLAVHQNRSAFFYTYWASECIGVVLGMAVTYEVFGHLFAAHPGLRKLARLIFRGALAALLVLGFAVFIGQAHTQINTAPNAILVIEEATRIVEVGLIMFLFLFSTAFGLHWRQPVFGIALGLGVFAAVELITVTVKSQMVGHASDALSIVRMVSYNLSLLIWLGYLLTPERVSINAEVPKRAQLEQWNQAVMELISR